MDARAQAIAAGLEAPPLVERSIYGEDDPERILARLEAFTVEHLGAGIARVVFQRTSTGCVTGLALEDGRAVTLKGHAPARAPRLAACQAVQASLSARGFPAPAPLLAPTPGGLMPGVFTAEETVSAGSMLDPYDPALPRRLAEALARLVALAADAPREGLGPSWFGGLPEGQLWPRPHSPIFDFSAPAEDPGWIDALARRARALPRAGTPVIGHFDWRVEHLGYEGERLVAAYDWDSLHLEREPIVVGAAAHAFTASWDTPPTRGAPTEAEVDAFFEAYESARGAPFDAAERATRDAAFVYGLAYTTRCTFCHPRAERSPQAQSFAARLAELGPRRLRAPA